MRRVDHGVERAPFHYVELADDLERQIRGGVYRDGERLPSIRRLRVERGLAMSTVGQALGELERRGLVEARPRSGYFVRVTPLRLPPPAMKRHRARPRRVPLPHVADTFVTASADPALVPLGGAVLSPELVPLKHLVRAVKDVAARRPKTLALYGPPAGSPELRREIAKRLLGLGIAATPDEVVISSGCMDAIRLALMAVAKPGDVIALESPTFFGFLQLVRDLGLRALEIPTDPTTGIDLDSLAAGLAEHDVRALVVTPNFQNPTGAVMPEDHKRRLGRLARRHRLTVIEDDIYGDLHFAPRRPPTLAALDGECDVIYCSSFSKTLAPGLRIGWLLPGRHVDAVRRLKLSGTITSPGLNQLVIAEFLETGSYDRYLRRLRGALKTQVGAALTAVARHFPAGTSITDPEGGFLLWAALPNDIDTVAAYDDAHNEGISFLPGRLCTVGPKYQNCVRLSAGYPWTDTLESGVQRLGQLLR